MNSGASPNDHESGWDLAEIAVGGFVGLVYLATLSTSIVGGDAPLFATIYADGGYAHPPGYPLYSMYLRAASVLPFAEPATGAAFATMLPGLAAVVVLYRALRSWSVGRFGAAFGALAFGLASHVWLMHTQPEVFALNHLLAALLVWLAGPNPPVTGRMRAATLGLVAGLGLSHHHTLVLMAPLGLWGVYRATVESERGAIETIAVGAGALAVGLLPYGYLLVVAGADLGWHWGSPEGLGDLVHLFLRRDYGTLSMTAGETPVEADTQLAFLARGVGEDMLYLTPLLAIWGTIASIVRSGRERRRATLALVASLLLCGPLFVTLLTRHPEGIDRLLLRRFHLLPELQIAFLAGLGLSRLPTDSLHRWTRRVLLGGFAAAALAAGLPVHAAHRAPTVEQYVHDTFGPLPDEAIVVGTGDHNAFGALYYQRALGRRPDVTYFDAQMLAHRWYNRRVTRELDIDFPYRGESIDLDRLVDAMMETGRPVFATGPFHPELLAGRPASPVGTLVRIHPPGEPPPHPRELFRHNRAWLDDAAITPRPGAEPHTWSRLVLGEYAANWETLAGALEAAGETELAGRARELAGRFAPWRADAERPDEPAAPGG